MIILFSVRHYHFYLILKKAHDPSNATSCSRCIGYIRTRAWFFFGHTRLSIIDLSMQAIQPMESVSGQSQIVFHGEIILHDVFSQYVPPQISQSSKQGFSPPFESWSRHGLSTWLMEEIFTQQSTLNDLIDMGVAWEIFQAHLHGAHNHRLFIWSMISLSLFHQKFMALPL